MLALPATASETVTYSYDALGRLSTAQHSGGPADGQSATTTYDAAGNRTNQSVNAAGSGGGGGGSAQLAIGNASVTEGGTLSFTVTRSGTTTSAVSAHYATASGTATSGSDFTAQSGTVSFAANQTTAIISVATTNDSIVESVETMSVTLSSPSGATITNAIGTGTIIDNDTVWSSSFTSGTWGYCYYSCTYLYGYAQSTMGSMSNVSFNGYTITSLYNLNGGMIYLSLSGSSTPPNSGWTSITIPGVGTLNRSSASYSSSTGSATWSWYSGSIPSSGTVTIQ